MDISLQGQRRKGEGIDRHVSEGKGYAGIKHP